jgi:cytoskeletal protein CcmA (bactofilin family)
MPPKEFSAANAADRTDNTVIGASILISGKLTGDEDLTVRGRVEGEVNLTRTLIVEPSGIVKANVSVKNAIVSGVVVGNIAATESVELTQEGRMVGDIHSPRVIIVDGASFRGQIDMGDATPRAEGAERTSRPSLVRATVRPAAPVAKPAVGKPAPVVRPATAAITRVEAVRPAPPPPPPAPPVLAEAGKKKVLVKKKK